MKVFAAGERQRHGTQTLHINPAAHLKELGQAENCPRDWFDHEGNPRNMTVVFEHGCAEVSDEVGRYLTAHKMARKTALILPGDALAA